MSDQMLADFELSLVTSHLPRSRKQYVGVARRFLAWLADAPLTQQAVATYSAQVVETKASTSARTTLVALRVFLLHLENTGTVPPGFVAQCPAPPRARFTAPRVATPDEVSTLIGYVGHPYDLAFGFLAWLGLRISEAVKLSWSDVDLPRGIVRVQRKGGATMELPFDIAPQLSAMLSSRAQDAGYIFAGRRGGHLTDEAVRKALTRACEQLNLRHLNPHAFRHGFAHQAALNRVSTQGISAALGHSSLQVTQTYLTGLAGPDAIRAAFGMQVSDGKKAAV